MTVRGRAVLPAITEERWMESAACASPDVDPEWFYRQASAADYDPRARDTCASCPVKAACLAYALGCGDIHGFFADTTPLERSKIRRAG